VRAEATGLAEVENRVEELVAGVEKERHRRPEIQPWPRPGGMRSESRKINGKEEARTTY
jgi:hypothetical protein